MQKMRISFYALLPLFVACILAGCQKNEAEGPNGNIAEMDFTMNGLGSPELWGEAVAYSSGTKAIDEQTAAPMPANAEFSVRVYDNAGGTPAYTSDPAQSAVYKVTDAESGTTAPAGDKLLLRSGAYAFNFVYPATFAPTAGKGSVANGTDFMALTTEETVAPDANGKYAMEVQLKRLCSRLDIKISPKDGAMIKSLEIGSNGGTLSGLSESATYTIGAEALEASGTSGTYAVSKDLFTASGTTLSTESGNGLVLLPVAGTTLGLKIDLVINGTAKTMAVSVKNTTLKAGYRRTLELTVDQSGEAAFTIKTTKWDVDEQPLTGELEEYAENLSEKETANCYIVNKPGTLYQFDASVMGNGQPLDIDAKYFRTEQQSAAQNLSGSDPIFGGDKTLEPKGAFIVWSTGNSINDVITDVTLDTENKIVKFRTAEGSALKQGNAVIAVTDDDGNIVWSWHIWATDYTDADALKYGGDYGSPVMVGGLSGEEGSVKCEMMDRNLGALNKTAGDIGSTGLLYQWGRKDPFIGSNSWGEGASGVTEGVAFSGSAQTTTDRNYGWSVVKVADVAEITGTKEAIEYAIAHPTAFMVGASGTYDWIKADDYANQQDWLWGNPNHETGNINAADNYVEKSIYDPCPPGYKMPQQHLWGLFTIKWGMPMIPAWTENSGEVSGTKAANGINFIYEYGVLANTSYYPAAGYRCGSADGWGKFGAVDGGIFDAGNVGAYWAAAPWKSSNGTETYGGAHFCFSVGQYQVSSDGVANTMSRDFGLSVRCVRISQ